MVALLGNCCWSQSRGPRDVHIIPGQRDRCRPGQGMTRRPHVPWCRHEACDHGEVQSKDCACSERGTHLVIFLGQGVSVCSVCVQRLAQWGTGLWLGPPKINNNSGCRALAARPRMLDTLQLVSSPGPTLFSLCSCPGRSEICVDANISPFKTGLVLPSLSLCWEQ